MTVVNELDYLSHVIFLRAHAYKLMYVVYFFVPSIHLAQIYPYFNIFRI